ncbi:hypothetical protein BDV09DRAFT_185180 [Aspergillus tetrazonus]
MNLGNPKEIFSPHPILTDKTFLLLMKYTHDALAKAVVSIVDRWWADTDAMFPTRMPLEAPAEAALQWIDKQSRNYMFPEFKDRLGNWRPDFLVTENESAMGPGFQICEINSRTPDNMVLFSAQKHRKIRQLMGLSSGQPPAGNPDDWEDSFLGLFNPHLPIHILLGRDMLEREELVRMLRHDGSSVSGYSLYCRNGGTFEKMHQVLATLAVNDLRVSLLVNDQRFLGIILQELNSLVTKHGILTQDQAEALQQCIQWIERNRRDEVGKGNYMLKTARQSRGSGHLLGADLSQQEWEKIMLGMQDPSIRPGNTSYVLQPFVQQVGFDLFGDEGKKINGSHMVGCYYSINGRFLGLEIWRSSTQKVCNAYGGSGCVLLYSVAQADVDG